MIGTGRKSWIGSMFQHLRHSTTAKNGLNPDETGIVNTGCSCPYNHGNFRLRDRLFLLLALGTQTERSVVSASQMN